jgi:hypothetical protein
MCSLRLGLVFAVTTVRCVGQIGAPSAIRGGAGGAGDGELAPPDCDAGDVSTEASVVRLLNRREYASTVRDLLGVDGGAVVARFPGDPILGFDNGAANVVASSALVEEHLAVAEALAAASDLDLLAPCPAGRDPRDCARDFIQGFGRRV